MRVFLLQLLALGLFPFSAQAEAHLTADLETALFSQNDFGVREGKRTDGVIILKDGKKIFEKYARGFSADKKHIMWSISKTVTALLYGVAVRENKVRLDQSICDFGVVPQKSFCEIKIRDLLSWTSAIQWSEEYEGAKDPRQSSVLAMIFGEGRDDMNQFVLQQPMLKASKPGQIWRYSSGDTILASNLLAKIFKTQNLRSVFQEKLFGPLGITDWLCESDSAGTLSGGYFFYLKLPDLARIGELILNEGAINGQTLVPKEFIAFMKTMPSAFKTNRFEVKAGYIPGSSLWINDPLETGLATPWPSAPKDSVGASGHWGQFLLIIPSKKIVAARVGDTRDGSFTNSQFAQALDKLW